MCVGREALENSRRPILVSEPRFCDGRFLHESADETAPTCHLVISARQFKKAVVCGGVRWCAVVPRGPLPSLVFGSRKRAARDTGEPVEPAPSPLGPITTLSPTINLFHHASIAKHGRLAEQTPMMLFFDTAAVTQKSAGPGTKPIQL